MAALADVFRFLATVDAISRTPSLAPRALESADLVLLMKPGAAVADGLPRRWPIGMPEGLQKICRFGPSPRGVDRSGLQFSARVSQRRGL